MMLVAVLVSSLLWIGHTNAQCPVGSCICETSSGTINLKSLGSDAGYSFSDIYDGYTYVYNPCYAYSYKECPSDTAVCQENAEGTAYFSTGSTSTEQIIIEGSDISVQYTDGDGGRISVVKLICDSSATSPVFTAKGEPYTLEYDFELKTKCACFNGCNDDTPTVPSNPSDGKTSAGVAIGEVGIALMSLAIVVIVAYFVVGAIVLHVRFERRGVEVIPQRSFWFMLPLLVKDGFVFTFSPIVRLVKKDKAQYQSIK